MGPRYKNLLVKETWRNTLNESTVIARFWMKSSQCMVLLVRSPSGGESWYEYFYPIEKVHFSGREVMQFERVRRMLQRVHQKRVLGKKSCSSRWRGTCCTRSGFSGHEHGPRSLNNSLNNSLNEETWLL
jgi:hypothetical protein